MSRSKINAAIADRIMKADASYNTEKLTAEMINEICDIYSLETPGLLVNANQFKAAYDEIFMRSNKFFGFLSRDVITEDKMSRFLKQSEVYSLRDQGEEFYINDFSEKTDQLDEASSSALSSTVSKYKSVVLNFEHDPEINMYFSDISVLPIESQCFLSDACLTKLISKSEGKKENVSAVKSIKNNPSVYMNFVMKEYLDLQKEFYKNATQGDLEELKSSKVSLYQSAENLYNNGLECYKQVYNAKSCLSPSVCNSYLGVVKKLIEFGEEFLPSEEVKFNDNTLLFDHKSNEIFIETSGAFSDTNGISGELQFF